MPDITTMLTAEKPNVFISAQHELDAFLASPSVDAENLRAIKHEQKRTITRDFGFAGVRLVAALESAVALSDALIALQGSAARVRAQVALDALPLAGGAALGKVALSVLATRDTDELCHLAYVAQMAYPNASLSGALYFLTGSDPLFTDRWEAMFMANNCMLGRYALALSRKSVSATFLAPQEALGRLSTYRVEKHFGYQPSRHLAQTWLVGRGLTAFTQFLQAPLASLIEWDQEPIDALVGADAHRALEVMMDLSAGYFMAELTDPKLKSSDGTLCDEDLRDAADLAAAGDVREAINIVNSMLKLCSAPPSGAFTAAQCSAVQGLRPTMRVLVARLTVGQSQQVMMRLMKESVSTS